MYAFVETMTSYIARPDLRQGLQMAILITGRGRQIIDGIMRWETWTLSATVQRKTLRERFSDARMAYQLSGEVLRGDEFVQVDFGNESERFACQVGNRAR